MSRNQGQYKGKDNSSIGCFRRNCDYHVCLCHRKECLNQHDIWLPFKRSALGTIESAEIV